VTITKGSWLNRNVILYGLSLAALLFIVKWIELRFMILDHSMEFYTGFIALLFTLLGIWLTTKLLRPKTVIVEKEILIRQSDFQRNDDEISRLGLSKRELEVLEAMAKGLSNQEIGEELFLSVNTIKTHCSNVLVKLDVKRRTQAVEKARRLMLIP
jgi:DNA-binding CsgD family transcriptional regulator